jgi:two-component system sensor histidine kinase QseC
MKASLWKRVAGIFRPTLVRRLVLAQMLMLTLLWSLFIAYILLESRNDKGMLNAVKTFDTILAVAHNLADRPQQRLDTLKLIEQALREDYSAGDSAEMSPSFTVRENGELIYRSHDIPADLRNTRLNEIEALHANGMRWRARTIASGNIEATMIIPADGWNLFININTRGYYLLPLLISLPFLLLPAWLSIRFGLRPWSKVAHEVSQRGPQDLTPLSFKPQHQELRAMVDSINLLLQRVAESTTRERSFIADAAHELRTPLAAMRVNVEALQGQTRDQRQQELLSGILNSGNRATRLVSQLLMLMRSDARSAVHLHKLALDGVLQDRLASLAALARNRQVELELRAETGVFVLGNRESLESLVDNLIENAVKYSPPHSTVTVLVRRRDRFAELRIADRGPGIPAALRERVFDRFFRAPDQTQSGSGLGLSIAKSVVLQHGGTIKLRDNDLDGGTCVEVSLPLMP